MNSKFAHKYIKNAHSVFGAGSDSDNPPTGDDIKIFKLGLDGNDVGTFFDQLGTIGVPGRARLNSANSLEAPTKPLLLDLNGIKPGRNLEV